MNKKNYKDIKFPEFFEYSSDGEHLPIEFYMNVLPLSETIELKLGYFSSKVFQVLALGFSQFVFYGGRIKIVTNHFLYEDDKDIVFGENDESNDLLYKCLLSDIELLYQHMTTEKKHFINCLKFLKNKGRLTITPVMLKPGKMAHYKQGIFTDRENNILFMDGSCNFTGRGLLENGETISICRSWGSDYEKLRVSIKKEDIKLVNAKINNKYIYLDHTHIFDAIDSLGEDKNIEELLEDELKLNSDGSEVEKINQLITLQKKEAMKLLSEIKNTPKFPFNSTPRDYQIDAYSKWSNAEGIGIFAMATGTGKTITSLNCLLNEYYDNGFYQALILVPGKILLNQWSVEASLFNFKNIIKCSSEYNYADNLIGLKNKLMFNKKTNFILITTYSSFASKKLQRTISKLPDSTLVIADEAHNLGQKSLMPYIKELTNKKRIGLSATPKRAYDPDGNQVIENVFNCIEPYTYSFSMKRAIEENILCKYDYYPHVVHLTEDEMEKYEEISMKLIKYFDFDNAKYRSEPWVDKLLMERKRIIHKAIGKLSCFRRIIKEYAKTGDKLKFAFVYAPEGNAAEGGKIIDKFMQVLKDELPANNQYAYVNESESKDSLLEHFENGDIDTIFSMKCLDEGVDIPRAEVGIFCSSTGNPRQFIQRRGRLLRNHEEKHYATIHDLVVIPKVSKNRQEFVGEQSLLKGELSRVVHFASLSRNYYEAMDTMNAVANEYELDMYELENELGDEI